MHAFIEVSTRAVGGTVFPASTPQGTCGFPLSSDGFCLAVPPPSEWSRVLLGQFLGGTHSSAPWSLAKLRIPSAAC